VKPRGNTLLHKLPASDELACWNEIWLRQQNSNGAALAERMRLELFALARRAHVPFCNPPDPATPGGHPLNRLAQVGGPLFYNNTGCPRDESPGYVAGDPVSKVAEWTSASSCRTWLAQLSAGREDPGRTGISSSYLLRPLPFVVVLVSRSGP